MATIPLPPTDNLYKFMAITGTIILILITFFLIWLRVLLFEYKKENDLYISKISIDAKVSEIKFKRENIDNDSNQYISEWLSGFDNKEKALNSLNEIELNIMDRKKELENIPTDDSAELMVERLNYVGWYSIFKVITIFGVFITVLGYALWWDKQQKIMDQLAVLNVKLKRQEVGKNKEDPPKKYLEGIKRKISRWKVVTWYREIFLVWLADENYMTSETKDENITK